MARFPVQRSWTEAGNVQQVSQGVPTVHRGLRDSEEGEHTPKHHYSTWKRSGNPLEHTHNPPFKGKVCMGWERSYLKPLNFSLTTAHQFRTTLAQSSGRCGSPCCVHVMKASGLPPPRPRLRCVIAHAETYYIPHRDNLRTGYGGGRRLPPALHGAAARGRRERRGPRHPR